MVDKRLIERTFIWRVMGNLFHNKLGRGGVSVRVVDRLLSTTNYLSLSLPLAIKTQSVDSFNKLTHMGHPNYRRPQGGRQGVTDGVRVGEQSLKPGVCLGWGERSDSCDLCVTVQTWAPPCIPSYPLPLMRVLMGRRCNETWCTLAKALSPPTGQISEWKRGGICMCVCVCACACVCMCVCVCVGR